MPPQLKKTGNRHMRSEQAPTRSNRLRRHVARNLWLPEKLLVPQNRNAASLFHITRKD